MTSRLCVRVPSVVGIAGFVVSCLQNGRGGLDVRARIRKGVRSFFGRGSQLRVTSIRKLFLNKLTVQEKTVVMLLFSVITLILVGTS